MNNFMFHFILLTIVGFYCTSCGDEPVFNENPESGDVAVISDRDSGNNLQNTSDSSFTPSDTSDSSNPSDTSDNPDDTSDPEDTTNPDDTGEETDTSDPEDGEVIQPDVCQDLDDNCNGIDDDCDGTIDEDGPIYRWYHDRDGDGFGNAQNHVDQRCHAPEGYIRDNSDCYDHNSTVYPGAPEICDARDNDCDGEEDEGFPIRPWYHDLDGDGYGSVELTIEQFNSCRDEDDGVSRIGGDCDDVYIEGQVNEGGQLVNPGAPEICDNGIDDNCSGEIDETPCTTL